MLHQEITGTIAKKTQQEGLPVAEAAFSGILNGPMLSQQGGQAVLCNTSPWSHLVPSSVAGPKRSEGSWKFFCQESGGIPDLLRKWIWG